MVVRAQATVYNVPATMIDGYRRRNLIVRSSSPAELVACLRRTDLTSIRFMQLISPSEDTGCLENFAPGVPLEIVLEDPDRYEQLYNYANLLDSHPLRIAIPVIPGFSKAVKLAVSLNYGVKLQFDQPDKPLLDEVASILDLYLHRSVVNQPIEFFHTLLLFLYRDEPASLWEITEEDAAIVRYITDDGDETISNRFVGVNGMGQLDDFVDRFARDLINEHVECHECEFFNRCRGYFKWPDKTYSCDGIKRLFRTLEKTVGEVKQDLASFEMMEVQAQS